MVLGWERRYAPYPYGPPFWVAGQGFPIFGGLGSESGGLWQGRSVVWGQSWGQDLDLFRPLKKAGQLAERLWANATHWWRTE